MAEHGAINIYVKKSFQNLLLKNPLQSGVLSISNGFSTQAK